MAPNKKGEQPRTSKVAIDKTFGLKNKKGAAVQKHIKQITATSAQTADEKRLAALREAKQKEKAAAEAARLEAAELFKPVQVQKVPFGVDPKTVVCQFFKKGACEKGKKCKFSHDLDVGRKTEKRNLYADSRDENGAEGQGAEKSVNVDDMSTWDEEKLRTVVLSKHGNPKTTTDKVCVFFLQAVEEQKYGWNWVCPNGGDKCMYKHSLPPGFILKTKEQRAAEKALMDKNPSATLTLEDWLESERHKLTGTLTPVTEETFAKWKKERMDKKQAEEEARKAKEATGRALFEKGGWDVSEDEDDDDDGEHISKSGAWNLDALRRETEMLREKKEQERLNAVYGANHGNDMNENYYQENTEENGEGRGEETGKGKNVEQIVEQVTPDEAEKNGVQVVGDDGATEKNSPD